MLEQFLVSGVFAFMIVFVRFGTAIMIMPGVGDSYVPQNIRLHFALGFSLVMSPVIQSYVPYPMPALGSLLLLLATEFLTGLFIGTVSRILMLSLDTAGMLISLSSGISNAQVFNPQMATQGSVFGAFLSVTGVTVLFVTNLHHLLIHGLVDSYNRFPIGTILNTGDMADLMAKAVSSAFMTGFEIAMPFIVISMVLYVGMGVLSRLMPQMQIFMVAIPVQIALALVILALSMSAIMLFFVTQFEEGMIYFLSQGEQ